MSGAILMKLGRAPATQTILVRMCSSRICGLCAPSARLPACIEEDGHRHHDTASDDVHEVAPAVADLEGGVVGAAGAVEGAAQAHEDPEGLVVGQRQEQ